MHVEYEEFSSVADIFSYMAAVMPPMKNTMPINYYKGHVFAFIPLTHNGGDVYLMIYTKAELDGRILEFDINANTFKKVLAIERADKTYFVVVSPKRNTIADEAIKKLA